jgi:LemA protein
MAALAIMGLAVGLVAVGGLVVLLTTYNGVVAMQRRADKAWANVDVALKQRYDELPNLVEAVRDVMAYERVVLEDVTNARAAYAPLAPLPSQAAASDATTAAVRSLFAVVERYPQLHAQANVMSLQAEIERLESLIATRREFFNDSVYLYNATIRQVPAVLFAGAMAWKPRDFFRAPDEARSEVPVALDRPGPTPEDAPARSTTGPQG